MVAVAVAVAVMPPMELSPAASATRAVCVAVVADLAARDRPRPLRRVGRRCRRPRSGEGLVARELLLELLRPVWSLLDGEVEEAEVEVVELRERDSQRVSGEEEARERRRRWRRWWPSSAAERCE